MEKYLNIYDEIKILLLQIKEFLRLKFSKVNSRKNKKVINNICLSIFDKQTIALRIYFLAKKYLEEINPSTIIFLRTKAMDGKEFWYLLLKNLIRILK